jgi:hypothetical protein
MPGDEDYKILTVRLEERITSLQGGQAAMNASMASMSISINQLLQKGNDCPIEELRGKEHAAVVADIGILKNEAAEQRGSRRSLYIFSAVLIAITGILVEVVNLISA